MNKVNLYLRKASNRVLKTLLKCHKVYELVEHVSDFYRVSLPSYDDSEDLLLRVEPYHELGKVRKKLWPADPKVCISVIVPCFNVERYVESCINSIATQVSSRPFEIIAVDDGSTDNTGVILDEISSRVANLNVIHQPNQGHSGARNTGIANAKGSYLVFVDSDDLLKSDALEKLANSISLSGADFVTASYDNMSEDGSAISPSMVGGSMALLGREYTLVMCGAMLIFLKDIGLRIRFKGFSLTRDILKHIWTRAFIYIVTTAKASRLDAR